MPFQFANRSSQNLDPAKYPDTSGNMVVYNRQRSLALSSRIAQAAVADETLGCWLLPAYAGCGLQRCEVEAEFGAVWLPGC
jgi:hypothetical protein